MAEPIDFRQLELTDPAILEQTQFGPDMQRWLSTLVDTINQNMITLNQFVAYLIEAQGVDIGGGGAGPISVPVIGLTSNGYVLVTLISTSNPGISVTDVTPGTNAFDITFSGDPGASAIIVYKAFISQPL